MHAVIRLAGHQYTVKPEETLTVPRLETAAGQRLTVDQVLYLGDGERGLVGKPTVPGASVELEVLEHNKGPKIHVFKMKRRKNYRRHTGSRAYLTQVRVVKING